MTKPNVVNLEAKERETGRKNADKLREEERIPAVVYGPTLEENFAISIDEIELEKILSVSRTQIIELEFENGDTHRALLKDVSFHPVTDRVLHADFYALSEDHEVTLKIPIRLTGTAIGVTDGGGRVFQPMHIVRIKTLPSQIQPEYTLDITPLTIGDSLHVSDLELGDVTPLDDLSRTIVTIRPPKSEELLEATLATAEPEEEAEEGELAEGEEPEAAEGEEQEGEGEGETPEEES